MPNSDFDENKNIVTNISERYASLNEQEKAEFLSDLKLVSAVQAFQSKPESIKAYLLKSGFKKNALDEADSSQVYKSLLTAIKNNSNNDSFEQDLNSVTDGLFGKSYQEVTNNLSNPEADIWANGFFAASEKSESTLLQDIDLNRVSPETPLSKEDTEKLGKFLTSNFVKWAAISAVAPMMGFAAPAIGAMFFKSAISKVGFKILSETGIVDKAAESLAKVIDAKFPTSKNGINTPDGNSKFLKVASVLAVATASLGLGLSAEAAMNSFSSPTDFIGSIKETINESDIVAKLQDFDVNAPFSENLEKAKAIFGFQDTDSIEEVANLKEGINPEVTQQADIGTKPQGFESATANQEVISSKESGVELTKAETFAAHHDPDFRFGYDHSSSPAADPVNEYINSAKSTNMTKAEAISAKSTNMTKAEAISAKSTNMTKAEVIAARNDPDFRLQSPQDVTDPVNEYIDSNPDKGVLFKEKKVEHSLWTEISKGLDDSHIKFESDKEKNSAIVNIINKHYGGMDNPHVLIKGADLNLVTYNNMEALQADIKGVDLSHNVLEKENPFSHKAAPTPSSTSSSPNPTDIPSAHLNSEKPTIIPVSTTGNIRDDIMAQFKANGIEFASESDARKAAIEVSMKHKDEIGIIAESRGSTAKIPSYNSAASLNADLGKHLAISKSEPASEIKAFADQFTESVNNSIAKNDVNSGMSEVEKAKVVTKKSPSPRLG